MEAGSGFDRSAGFNKFGVAEGVGFEPTEGTRPSTAFKAAAFVHSATPPPRIYLPQGFEINRYDLVLAIRSTPPMKGRRASGMATDPSGCW